MADKGKFAQWNHTVGTRITAVKDLWDPTPGLPGTPAVGDRYIATATANGWTNKNIYQWNGAAWVPTAPVLNMQTRVENKNAQYLYDGTNWIVISTAMKTGRNAALANVPPERGAEWNGTATNQHTIRKGRAAWAKTR